MITKIQTELTEATVTPIVDRWSRTKQERITLDNIDTMIARVFELDGTERTLGYTYVDESPDNQEANPGVSYNLYERTATIIANPIELNFSTYFKNRSYPLTQVKLFKIPASGPQVLLQTIALLPEDTSAYFDTITINASNANQTITFYVEYSDTNGASFVPNVQPEEEASTSNRPFQQYYFKYPTFYGVAAAGATVDYTTFIDKILTRDLSNKPVSFYTSAPSNSIYILRSTGDAAIYSIKDINGFETISDWVSSTVTIVCDDGNNHQFEKLEFKNKLIDGNYNFTINKA